MYLSWSIVHLIVVVSLSTFILFYLWGNEKTNELLKTKQKVLFCLAAYTGIFFTAVDFGTKQEFINRTKYNIKNEIPLERINVESPDRDSVKREFDNTVNQKKEEMNEEID